MSHFCPLTFPQAHFSFSLGSLFLFFRLIFPPPSSDMCKWPAAVLGNLSLKKKKLVKGGGKVCDKSKQFCDDNFR